MNNGYFRSPQKWKQSSLERFKRPSRRRLSPLNQNEPLGKAIFRKIRRFLKSGRGGKGFKLFFRGALILGSLGLFFGAIALAGAVAWYGRNLPDPNKLYDRSIELSTKIYDRTGEHLLYDIHGDKKRTLVPLKEIPPHVIKATIALEDQNFYKHNGFSLWGMFRGVILSTLKGQRAQGGSTLTQQLVKNAILTNERRVSRKLKELILAYRLEKKYTKDEILQLYFNEIGYGSTAYGVEAASQMYFGKSVRDVTLAEAAILAALPQAPTFLSPYGNHTDALYARQRYALEQMVSLGDITREEADAAEEEKIIFAQKRENIEAPHFVMYVKELLTEKYGEREVEQGGLSVITTLDYDLQKKAEEAVAKGIAKVEQYGGSNAALVAINPSNGQVLAMVGSRDYFDTEHDGNVNVVLRPRQPGSSFKPIAYAEAFLRGYTPETMLYDVVTTFKTDTKDYTPQNYNLKEHGPVSMRKALAGSLNIPAVKTLYLAGIDSVLDLAETMGYSTLGDRSRFGLSLVLGGGEVKLLEHAAAYGIFAKDGEYHEPAAILKITDKNGGVLETYRDESKQALDANVARQITDILSDDGARSYIFGAGGVLTLPDRPVAAKTGTTNDFHDAWTVGYTPQLVTGVWAGNNNNAEMKGGADGSVIAAPIWNAFMKAALQGKDVLEFTKPEPTDVQKPALKGGEDYGVEKIKIDKISGKLAGPNTPPEAVEEKGFQKAHSILYSVMKDDPRGPAPEDPSADPQFQNWEDAVRQWVEKQGFKAEEPPTEYDTVHRPEDAPRVDIATPQNNATISSRDMQFSVATDAPRGVREVRYYIDDVYVGKSLFGPSFSFSYRASDLESGFHTLKAKALDDLLNEGTDERLLNFQLPREPVSASFTGPQPNTSYYRSSFPLIVSAYLSSITRVKNVAVILRGENGIEDTLANIAPPTEKFVEVKWESPPSPGAYAILFRIEEEGFSPYYTNAAPVFIR